MPRRRRNCFLATGATRWNDPKQFPWTMGWLPSYHAEAAAYAKYLLKEKPDAKIGVLYQNDDFGKDYLKGPKEGFGDKAASRIVAEASYEVSEPTIDSQIVKLKAAGVDTLFSFAVGKFAAQSIKKVAELGWKPLHIVPNASSSVGSVIRPAGFENAQDVLSATFAKDPTDPQWKDDPGMQKFYAYVEKYIPEGKAMESTVLSGYSIAQTMVEALKQCGDDLTHENLMKQAANLKNVQLDGLLPGRDRQHQPDRLLAHRPVPDDELQGRALAALRRDHQGRDADRSAVEARDDDGRRRPDRHRLRRKVHCPFMTPVLRFCDIPQGPVAV